MEALLHLSDQFVPLFPPFVVNAAYMNPCNVCRRSKYQKAARKQQKSKARSGGCIAEKQWLCNVYEIWCFCDAHARAEHQDDLSKLGEPLSFSFAVWGEIHSNAPSNGTS